MEEKTPQPPFLPVAGPFLGQNPSPLPARPVYQVSQEGREKKPPEKEDYPVRPDYHEDQGVLDDGVADGKVEEDEKGLFFSDVRRAYGVDYHPRPVGKADDDARQEGNEPVARYAREGAPASPQRGLLRFEELVQDGEGHDDEKELAAEEEGALEGAQKSFHT